MSVVIAQYFLDYKIFKRTICNELKEEKRTLVTGEKQKVSFIIEKFI